MLSMGRKETDYFFWGFLCLAPRFCLLNWRLTIKGDSWCSRLLELELYFSTGLQPMYVVELLYLKYAEYSHIFIGKKFNQIEEMSICYWYTLKPRLLFRWGPVLEFGLQIKIIVILLYLRFYRFSNYKKTTVTVIFFTNLKNVCQDGVSKNWLRNHIFHILSFSKLKLLKWKKHNCEECSSMPKKTDFHFPNNK